MAPLLLPGSTVSSLTPSPSEDLGLGTQGLQWLQPLPLSLSLVEKMT